MSSLSAALKPTLLAETLMKKLEETLLNQNISKKIKTEIEKITKVLSEFFEFVQKVQKLVFSLLAKLLPEKFMNPLNRLFKAVKDIPLDKLKQFIKQSVVVVEKLFQSIKEPVCSGCVTLCTTYGPLGRQEESESNLVEFIGKFKDLSDGVFSLLPMDFIDRVLKADFKTDNQIIELLNEQIEKAQNTLEKTGEFIKDATDKINPLLLLPSFQPKLQRRNSDIFFPQDTEESIEEVLESLEKQGNEIDEKEKAQGLKFFDKLKKHSEETMKYIEDLVKDVKNDTLSFLKELDFLQLEKLLEMIRDFIKNFSLQKFLGYVQNVAETVQFLASYKDVLLQLIKSPGNFELFQKIFACFFHQPEFMKEAFILFQELTQIVDLNELISIFEDFVELFTKVDLFKSTDLIDSIKNDSDALRELLVKAYEKFKEIAEKITKTVTDFVLPFYYLGKDQLEKIFKLPSLDFNIKLPKEIFDLNFNPKDFAKKQLMLIDSGMSTITNLGSQTFDGMIDLTGKTFDASEKLAKGAIKGVSDAGTKTIDGVVFVGKGFGDMGMKTFDATGKLTGDAVKGVGEFGTKTFDTTGKLTGDALKGVGNAGSKTVDGVKSVGKGVGDLGTKTFDTTNKFASDTVQGIGKGVTDTSSFVTGGVQDVSKGVTNLGGKVVGDVGNVFKKKPKQDSDSDVEEPKKPENILHSNFNVFGMGKTSEKKQDAENSKLEEKEEKPKKSATDSLVNSNLNILGIGKSPKESPIENKPEDSKSPNKSISDEIFNSNLNVLGIGKKTEKKEEKEDSHEETANDELKPQKKSVSDSIVNSNLNVLGIGKKTEKKENLEIAEEEIKPKKKSPADSIINSNLNVLGIGKKSEKKVDKPEEPSEITDHPKEVTEEIEVKSPKKSKTGSIVNSNLNVFGIGKKTENKSDCKDQISDVQVSEENAKSVEVISQSNEISLEGTETIEENKEIPKDIPVEEVIKSPKKSTADSIINSNLNILGIGKKTEKKESTEDSYEETVGEESKPQKKSVADSLVNSNLNILGIGKKSEKKETSDVADEELTSPKKSATDSIVNSNLNILGIGKKTEKKEKTENMETKESTDEHEIKSPKKSKTGSIINSNLNILGIGKKSDKQIEPLNEQSEQNADQPDPEHDNTKSDKKSKRISGSNFNVFGIGKKRNSTDNPEEDSTEKKKGINILGLGKKKTSNEQLDKLSDQQSEASDETNDKPESKKQKGLGLGQMFTTSSKKNEKSENDMESPKGVKKGLFKRNSMEKNEKEDESVTGKKSPGRGNQMFDKIGFGKKK